MGSMQYRELGRTGIRVSTIGFGAWAIGGPVEISGTPVGPEHPLARVSRPLQRDAERIAESNKNQNVLLVSANPAASALV